MTQRTLYELLKDEVFNTLFKLHNGEIITRETVKPVKDKAIELYQTAVGGLDYDPSFFLEEDEVVDYAGQYKYFAENLSEAIASITLILIDMGFNEIEGGDYE